MKVAVIGTSAKENEKRVAIYPKHIKNLSKEVRQNLYFEKDYGKPFGIDDKIIEELTGNSTLSRTELLREFPCAVIPKPVLDDFKQIPDGGTVWGWIHSVQNADIAQLAINKKLTYIAWENMYFKTKRGRVHVFHKNNEMAGYCGVQHALELCGLDGNFGEDKKIVILGMGSVSRGAIFALKGHGFSDIAVCTHRSPLLIANRLPGITYYQMLKNRNGALTIKDVAGFSKPLTDLLTDADIIVNGVLQNPNKPVNFINEDEIENFYKRCLIIDISCDTKMGFSFACPTTFEKPILKFGNISYYAVDHTPSLLWESASCEISSCVTQFLPYLVKEKSNEVLDDAIDIKDGEIINTDIISYQNRETDYPYKIK